MLLDKEWISHYNQYVVLGMRLHRSRSLSIVEVRW